MNLSLGKFSSLCNGLDLEKEISIGSFEWLANDICHVIFVPFFFQIRVLLVEEFSLVHKIKQHMIYVESQK